MCLLAAVFTLAACSGHEASAEQSIPKARRLFPSEMLWYIRIGSLAVPFV